MDLGIVQGYLGINGDFEIGASANFIPDSIGAIAFLNRGATQYIKVSNSDINLGNIIILDAAGVGNAGELQSDIKTDDIEIGFRGGVFDFDGKLDTKGFAVYCSGDWTNTGTFVNGSGTVIFNGDAAQTIISGGQDFYNVTLDNNSIELTMTAGNPLTIDGALVISASKMPTITIYGNNLTVNGTTNGSVGATANLLLS